MRGLLVRSPLKLPQELLKMGVFKTKDATLNFGGRFYALLSKGGFCA